MLENATLIKSKNLEDERISTIKVKNITKKRLDTFGIKNESYDDIINKCLSMLKTYVDANINSPNPKFNGGWRD